MTSRALFALIALLVTPLLAGVAHAETRSMCVYDPAGRSGDFFRHMEGYALESSGWGVPLELRPYTDEETAAKDYEAGNCDAVVATGVRLQRFNRFPSTIEAMGAAPTYEVLSQMVATLAKYDSAAKKLRSGNNETVGFLSAGAVYLFVRDRNLDSVSELAGKRIATMDYDLAAPTLVQRIGAVMVAADLGSIGPKFNNGDVDACYMSAPGYQPFELWRGMDNGGGVIKRPLAQATLQVMVNVTRFPETYPKQARTWFAAHFEETLDNSRKADASIGEQYWITVPEERGAKWDLLFQEVRIALRDDVGAYDGSMLSALRKLRCAQDPARAECADSKE